jgi:hypothetical protein
MSVRRTALIIVIFAIVACGIGSVQADAASPPPGRAAASAPVLQGERCETVHSSVRPLPGASPTGTICVYVAGQSRAERSGVSFTARSGLLKAISVETLQLSVDGHVMVTIRNVSGTALTGGGVHLVNWWDEPAHLPHGSKSVQVGVYKACMTWTDGGEACTGPGWLYTFPVRV